MPKVIILGGGVAGMSAAHELAERGFQVEVYEGDSQYCGGKARSINVPGNDAGKLPLPGEHGFRFFPGFYKHVTDTMKRIPAGKGKNVYDNLVSTEFILLARNNKPSVQLLAHFPHNSKELEFIFSEMYAGTGLTQEEISFFSARIWQLMTSCQERRRNDYEKIGWWQYVEADRFSDTYKALLADGLTRTLVAAQAKTASTKTGGDMFLQMLFNMFNPFVNTDRVLNSPTNEAWLNYWLLYLVNDLKVEYNFDHALKEIICSNGKVTAVKVVTDKNEMKTVTGDYYLFAVPVEKFATFITDDMLKADPTLSNIKTLSSSVSWMKGVQYFLSEDVKINAGHVIFSDSPWALTCISQPQFWHDVDMSQYGKGNVKGVISVDVSDWFSPGLNGKRACDCTFDEVKNEVWAQMKNALNVNGQVVLRDDMIVEWFSDLDLADSTGSKEGYKESDDEPLFINMVNTWNLRPEAYTGIPNMYLASDYVRTSTDLACMDGANEAARRAVNSIISVSGKGGRECETWNLHEPWILAPFRWEDAKRYKKGLAWVPELSWITKTCIFFVRILLKIFKKKKNKK